MQIATYKVRTVRVLEESKMTDSANDGSGHISNQSTTPVPPDLSDSTVSSWALPALEFCGVRTLGP